MFEAQGVEAVVTKSGDGFTEIRTKDTRLLPAVPSPTPSPSVDPSASAGASASAGRQREPPRASAPPRHRQRPSPERVAVGRAPSAGASPGASPVRAARRPAAQLPTLGKIGEIRVALEDELGTIAEQRSLSTVGAVVSRTSCSRP